MYMNRLGTTLLIQNGKGRIFHSSFSKLFGFLWSKWGSSQFPFTELSALFHRSTWLQGGTYFTR